MFTHWRTESLLKYEVCPASNLYFIFAIRNWKDFADYSAQIDKETYISVLCDNIWHNDVKYVRKFPIPFRWFVSSTSNMQHDLVFSHTFDYTWCYRKTAFSFFVLSKIFAKIYNILKNKIFNLIFLIFLFLNNILKH